MTVRPRTTVHVMRHGEVHNPEKILYGRKPGFYLSERGKSQAQETRSFQVVSAPETQDCARTDGGCLTRLSSIQPWFTPPRGRRRHAAGRPQQNAQLTPQPDWFGKPGHRNQPFRQNA